MSAAAALSPACWWTENSPEAGSLFEMCGSAPGGEGIKVSKSAFSDEVSTSAHRQLSVLITFASTTLSLRVCSAVCVRRFVPISSMVAVWLWTTCGGMLMTSGFILLWMTFSNCGWKRERQQKVKLAAKKKDITRKRRWRWRWTLSFLCTVHNNFSSYPLQWKHCQMRETLHWNLIFWALQPPSQRLKSTESNMYNQTCQEGWIIKTWLSPSLGISTDANSHWHAVTFKTQQINNPSIQSSIHPSDSMSSGYQCHWEAQGVDKYTAAPTNRLVPVGRPVTNETVWWVIGREVQAGSHKSQITFHYMSPDVKFCLFITLISTSRRKISLIFFFFAIIY